MHLGIDARILGRRGVGRYLKNLSAAMAAQAPGDSFTLFLGPKSDPAAVPVAANVTGVRLAGHPAWVEQLALPFAAAAHGCDLLFCPDNSGPLLSPLPFVLTMHDTMWRRPLSQAIRKPAFGQRLQDRYRKWVCPAAARGAAAVLTITEFSRRDVLGSLGLPASKVVAVPEGLDPRFARPAPAARAKALCRGLGLARPFVLATGAADVRKNGDRLIEAFALAGRRSPLLLRSELVLTSMDAAELATTTYRATAERCGVSGRVRYLGYVSDEQLGALYQEALLFAFPSLWEGFGLPVLEAFSLGCPVLASCTTALPETAGAGALLVDPTDTDALARGLAALARPGARRNWALRGRKELKRFSWQAAARASLDVFRSALAPARE